MHPITCLDVGGSSIKSGIIFDDKVHRYSRVRYNSNADWKSIIACLASLIHPSATRVALSFPGPTDYLQGISYVKGQEKLGSLYKKNIRQLLASATQRAPQCIRMRNDAEAAILGEALYGAYATKERILGITLGTGMGSAVIENGKALYLPHPYSEKGELFAIPVEGSRADELFSIRGILHLAAKIEIKTTSVIDIARHAYQGDEKAKAVFREFGKKLGMFLALQEQRLAPALIILKGGISNAFPLFQNALSAQLSAPLKKGSLGDHAALLGVAELFKISKDSR